MRTAAKEWKPISFLLCFIIILVVFPQTSLAQSEVNVDSLIQKKQEIEQLIGDSMVQESGSKVWLSVMVLVFGFLTIWMLLRAMIKRKKFFGPNFTKIIGVTVILTFALLLATLDIQSNELVTALVGLIGTLGGYLFGKSDNYDSKDDKETQAEQLAREARERGDTGASPIG